MRHKEFSLFALLSIVLFIVSFVIVVALNSHWIHSLHKAFVKNSNIIKQDYIKSRKVYIKDSVNKTIKGIESRRLVALYNIKNIVYFSATNAVKTISSTYNKYKNRYKNNQIKDILVGFFNNARFYYGDGFYFFLSKEGNVVNSSNIALSAKTSDRYKMLFRDSYEGFVNGQTISGRHFVSYAKLFEPLNLYIVSCIFTDDFENKLKDSVMLALARKNSIKNKNEYIFINDTKGNIIILYDKIFNNQTKLWDLYETKENINRIKNIFKKELEAYSKDNGDFIYYKWYKPNSVKLVNKISYIRGYKPWGWIIGEGFYEDDALKSINGIKSKLNTTVMSVVRGSYIFLFFVLFGVIFISYIIFKVIYNRMQLIFKDFELSFRKNKKIDESKCKISELRSIMRYINGAIDRFTEYENEFLEAFVYSMETRDTYTKGHSQRVAFYSKVIARVLGFDEDKQEELYKAGLLHDIGKIGVPDNILLKPGRLTPNEYKIIQYHALFSYEIVSKIAQFQSMANYIRHHHERCDGSGYPDRLQCKDIEIEARILAIADVFDALTSKRAYRKQLKPKEAIEILKSEQLDQEIIAKVEDDLIENYLEESDVEFTLKQTKEIEKVRKEIFDIDYMTGLKRRKVLIEIANKLIKNKKTFAVIFVDIRSLSFVNYEFSMDAGDKLIVYSAIALSEILSKKGYGDPDYISRAYNDAFLFIVEDEKFLENINTLIEDIRKEMKKRVAKLFDDNDEGMFINERNESIKNFIDYHILYSMYPYDSKDVDRLIYLCVAKKETYRKKRY